MLDSLEMKHNGCTCAALLQPLMHSVYVRLFVCRPLHVLLSPLGGLVALRLHARISCGGCGGLVFVRMCMYVI